MESTASDRRRSVRQLLFVIAGAHTGAFAGSVRPTFGLSGDVASGVTVLLLFALPFVVDAGWECVDPLFEKLMH